MTDQVYPNITAGDRPLSTTKYLVVDNSLPHGETAVYEGSDVDEARKAWVSSQSPRAWAFTTMTYSVPLTLDPEAEQQQPPVETRWRRATRSLGKIVFPWR